MISRNNKYHQETGSGGHYTCDSNGNTAGLHSMNMDLTHKIRLKVLQGKFDPEPKDGPMIRKFRESGLTPEEFLETWKG